jgi:hypothetical protein
MPGAFTIDTGRTFALLMLMSTSPKTKFGTSDPDTAADGRAKWSAQVAATWLAEPGRRPVSEVLDITIVSDRDPGDGITPGSPVHVEGLRVGVSTPERTDRGVRGGKAWYQAEALRSMNGTRPKADG